MGSRNRRPTRRAPQSCQPRRPTALLRPFDFIVALCDGQEGKSQPVPACTWQQALDRAGPEELLGVGVAAYRASRPREAEQAWAAAASETNPWAAFNLGLLLQEQGDPTRAAAAYQVAIDSGHAEVAPTAAINLALLREEQGDLAGTAAAYQVAIDSGHAEAAPKAGIQSRETAKGAGSPGGAAAAYQVAIDSGHAE